jgi:membrane-associated phospholipid phosphatase
VWLLIRALKIRSIPSVAACIVLSGATRMGAQTVGRMVVHDVGHAANDVVASWLAPFHANGRDWVAAGSVVAIAALISPFDDNIDRWFVANRHSTAFSWLKQLREGGHAFSGATVTPAAVAVYGIGLATKNTAIRDGVWGCAASYASESIVRTQIIYRLFGRLRPDSMRGERVPEPSEPGDQYKLSYPGSRAWGMHSLPAGHIANVAACASFLSYRFEDPYVSVPAYAIALGVGVGREVDRRHWTSDTVLGALLGFVIGKEIATRSLERHREEAASSTTNNVHAIYIGPATERVLIGWTAQF